MSGHFEFQHFRKYLLQRHYIPSKDATLYSSLFWADLSNFLRISVTFDSANPPPHSLQNPKVLDFGFSLFFSPLKTTQLCQVSISPITACTFDSTSSSHDLRWSSPWPSPPASSASCGSSAALEAKKRGEKCGSDKAKCKRRCNSWRRWPEGGEASSTCWHCSGVQPDGCKRWVGGFGDWKVAMDVVVVVVALEKTNIKRRVGWKVLFFGGAIGEFALVVKQMFLK